MLEQETTAFMKQPCHKTAKILGKALFLAEMPVEDKQKILEQAFNRSTHSDTEAILNMWAVGWMLKDDLPDVRKIEAVRAVLDDAELNVPDIDDWIRTIYQDKQIPDALIDFLEKEFATHSRVSAEIKLQFAAKTLRPKNA